MNPDAWLAGINLGSGPQTVRWFLPDDVKVKSVELMRAESMIPFRSNGGALRCNLPRVKDYDVAAITVG